MLLVDLLTPMSCLDLSFRHQQQGSAAVKKRLQDTILYGAQDMNIKICAGTTATLFRIILIAGEAKSHNQVHIRNKNLILQNSEHFFALRFL